MVGAMAGGESLFAARERLAGALGGAGRRLWRRRDLTAKDEVVLDLVVEALARIGQLVRPRSQVQAEANLAQAPSGLRREVELLVGLARRSVVLPAARAVGGASDGGPQGVQESAVRRRGGRSSTPQRRPSCRAAAAPGSRVVEKVAEEAEEVVSGGLAAAASSMVDEQRLAVEEQVVDNAAELHDDQAFFGQGGARSSKAAGSEVGDSRPQWHRDLLEAFGIRRDESGAEVQEGLGSEQFPLRPFVFVEGVGWTPGRVDPLSDLWRARL